MILTQLFRPVSVSIFCFSAFVLTACGGGGGGGSSDPTPSPSLPPASVASVSSTAASVSNSLSSGVASLSSTAVSLSSTAVSLSSTAVSLSSAAASLSSTAASLSSNSISSSTSMVSVSSSALSTPGSSTSASSLSSSATSVLPRPAVPVVTLTYGIKQIQLAWPSVNGATFYRVMKNPDGHSGFTQTGADLVSPSFTDSIAVHLTDWINLSYVVAACNASGCTDSTTISGLDSTKAIGYFKASNTEAGDKFGAAVAISGDGNTLAVSAPSEDGSLETDNSALDSGAVYIYTHTAGSGWARDTNFRFKPKTIDAGDNFGVSLALSNDGNTLAVGADKDDSLPAFPNSDPRNNAAPDSGAVFVFSRSGSTWSQQAYLKGSHNNLALSFGFAVSLSGDGNVLAVGVPFDHGGGIGVVPSGTRDAPDVTDSGAAYVFERTGTTWSEINYIKASVASHSGDQFGHAVALSNDGLKLAVGARFESSANTDQTNTSAAGAGAVYILHHSPRGGWVHQYYLKAPNAGQNDQFGTSVALSEDGTTLAVGAPSESSVARGIDGDQTDNTSGSSGAVYVFTQVNRSWGVPTYIKSSNNVAVTRRPVNFGASVALSLDGNLLSVGAPSDFGTSVGMNGVQDFVQNSLKSGAVFTFARSASQWSQKSYAKAPNAEQNDHFGQCVSLSNDGFTLAVGAPDESSMSVLVGGSQTDNSAVSAGAVYLY